MSKITMMVGLPGSGKSTYREAYLKKNPNTVVLSTDDMIEDYAKMHNLNYTEAFSKVNFKMLNRVLEDTFQNAIKYGYDILVDRTNISVKSRASFIKRVPESYTKHAIIFEVNDDELKRRLHIREHETGKHIPAHVINDMQNKYVRPSIEEGFDEILVVK